MFTITNFSPFNKNQRNASFALTLLAGAYGLTAACSSDDTVTVLEDAGTDASLVVDASVEDSPVPDAPHDAGTDSAVALVDRGPTTLAFDGDPAGVFWVYGAQAALYVADDGKNRVARWRDGVGFDKEWKLPAPSGGDGGGGLGQIVRLLDGTTLVTRTGSGSDGTVLVIDATGDAGTLAALSGSRKRSGLAILIDGTLVDSYYQAQDGGFVGGLAKLTVSPDAGKEAAYASGLSQPQGIVFDEGAVFVADPSAGSILRVETDGGVSVRIPLEQGSVVERGGDGDLFVGGPSGSVRHVARNGTLSNIVTGLKEVRGLAYDGAHTRLFVAEHDPTGSGHSIRIIPLQ